MRQRPMRAVAKTVFARKTAISGIKSPPPPTAADCKTQHPTPAPPLFAFRFPFPPLTRAGPHSSITIVSCLAIASGAYGMDNLHKPPISRRRLPARHPPRRWPTPFSAQKTAASSGQAGRTGHHSAQQDRLTRRRGHPIGSEHLQSDCLDFFREVDRSAPFDGSTALRHAGTPAVCRRVARRFRKAIEDLVMHGEARHSTMDR